MRRIFIMFAAFCMLATTPANAQEQHAAVFFPTDILASNCASIVGIYQLNPLNYARFYRMLVPVQQPGNYKAIQLNVPDPANPNADPWTVTVTLNNRLPLSQRKDIYTTLQQGQIWAVFSPKPNRAGNGEAVQSMNFQIYIAHTGPNNTRKCENVLGTEATQPIPNLPIPALRDFYMALEGSYSGAEPAEMVDSLTKFYAQ